MFNPFKKYWMLVVEENGQRSNIATSNFKSTMRKIIVGDGTIINKMRISKDEFIAFLDAEKYRD